MKKLILFALITLLASACDHDHADPGPQVCGVTNPTQNLPWLKAQIDLYANDGSDFSQYRYIQQSTYQGNTVFIMGACCPLCEFSSSIFDCTGKEMSITIFDLNAPSTLIWKPRNSVCAFTQ